MSHPPVDLFTTLPDDQRIAPSRQTGDVLVDNGLTQRQARLQMPDEIRSNHPQYVLKT